MEPKDTTGAGKTLDKLMAWWQGAFHPDDEPEAEEYRLAIADQFRRETALLARLRQNRSTVRYEFLQRDLDKVIEIQSRIVGQLQRLATELGTAVSEVPTAAIPDTFGVVLSKDLHEAHDMYNEYARLSAQASFTAYQERFDALAREKEHLIRLLADLVPKIHN